jgi:hypothetical protein
MGTVAHTGRRLAARGDVRQDSPRSCHCRGNQFFWAEPMLVSSLTVWRAAAVMWAGLVLAAASEVGFPQAGRAPAPAPAAKLPFGGRS